jgi:cytidylate kinase
VVENIPEVTDSLAYLAKPVPARIVSSVRDRRWQRGFPVGILRRNPGARRPIGMNIVICGLTAAGKTTHALLTARRLGYDYVSASSLMLSRLDVAPDESNTLWARRFDELEKRRDENPVDEQVNALLAEQLQVRDHTVFDSWSAAWLDRGSRCLRVFIESDRRSRAVKARVSQEPHGPFLSIPDCLKLVDEKDESTALRLLPLLGVDLRRDRTPFDIVLDNSALISAPNIDLARRGISRFQTLLLDAIISRLGSGAASLN